MQKLKAMKQRRIKRRTPSRPPRRLLPKEAPAASEAADQPPQFPPGRSSAMAMMPTIVSHWTPDDPPPQDRSRGFTAAELTELSRPAVEPARVTAAAKGALAATGSARATGRGTLTLTPAPITIVPTPFPEKLGDPIIVHNQVTVNVQSIEFRELNAKLDAVITLLDRRSNDISGDVREQLKAEISAGRLLLTAPKPDRNWIDLLLLRPLKYLADKAGSAVIGGLAAEALNLLLKMLQ
jgi:hypothetical protein